MSTLAELRPSHKELVIDVLRQAEFDVTPWANTTGKMETNPAYCYEWGFKQDDKILLCLWYEDLEESDKGIYHSGQVRSYIRDLEATGHPAARRARRFDERVQDAYRTRLPIRVALVDARNRKKRDSDARVTADFRVLDSVSWEVSDYDWFSGEYTIRRLDPHGSHDDQFTPQISGDNDSINAAVQEATEADELGADLETIYRRDDLTATSRTAMIEARLGQGAFRASLIERWNGRCAVTGCTSQAVLRASHMQAWRDSTDRERLDPFNGLLLTANLDALFDRGLISFEDDGQMKVSDRLTHTECTQLGLPAALQQKLYPEQIRYLRFHRNAYFS